MTEKIKRKVGALSTEEQNFILASKDFLSIEIIAEKLNRSPDPIKRFIARQSLTGGTDAYGEEALTNHLRERLHAKQFWAEMKAQLFKEELAYFEDTWISLMKQFRENVTSTEEIQTKQWITLEIMTNRNMREKKLQLEQVERIQKLVDAQYALDEADRDNSMLMSLTQELAYARNSISSYTTDHMKILAQIKDITKDLKIARMDRIKKIEDGKVTFPGLLRQLEEADIREREGLEAEVISRAVDKSKKKFSASHQYSDGRYDQPFLTPETVGEDDGEETESN